MEEKALLQEGAVHIRMQCFQFPGIILTRRGMTTTLRVHQSGTDA
jgi:hypothetical protein